MSACFVVPVTLRILHQQCLLCLLVVLSMIFKICQCFRPQVVCWSWHCVQLPLLLSNNHCKFGDWSLPLFCWLVTASFTQTTYFQNVCRFLAWLFLQIAMLMILGLRVCTVCVYVSVIVTLVHTHSLCDDRHSLHVHDHTQICLPCLMTRPWLT